MTPPFLSSYFWKIILYSKFVHYFSKFVPDFNRIPVSLVLLWKLEYGQGIHLVWISGDNLNRESWNRFLKTCHTAVLYPKYSLSQVKRHNHIKLGTNREYLGIKINANSKLTKKKKSHFLSSIRDTAPGVPVNEYETASLTSSCSSLTWLVLGGHPPGLRLAPVWNFMCIWWSSKFHS